MIVRSDVAHDARVVREAATLAAGGHAVHVIGKDVPDGWLPPSGVTVGSVGASSRLANLRPTPGRTLPAHLSAAKWLLMPQHNQSVWDSFLGGVRHQIDRMAPQVQGWDVVHAHDFPVLPLGRNLADQWGAALVYDSHEWWSGRLRRQRPTPVRDRRERALEQRLGRTADAVLTVSPGIVERFRTWGWDHVHLVRNTFPRSEAVDLPTPVAPAGLVYAGRVGAGRDLETVVAAAGPELPLTLIGPHDTGFVSRLRWDESAVHVLPEVAPHDVDSVIAAAGVAVVSLEDSCVNHRLALPNKLFHAVRVGVPVVAADLPEMAGLVHRHRLGAVYRPGDARSFAAAAREVIDHYPALRRSVLLAREHLTWEVDAAELASAYAGLPLRGRP